MMDEDLSIKNLSGYSEPNEWCGWWNEMHQCSLFEKGRIIALREERRSVAQIVIWNLLARMKIC